MAWLKNLFVAALSAFLVSISPSLAQQGDSQCTRSMCIHAFVNGSEWTYQMEARIGQNEMGYMAIGFGTTMVNTPMVIMWSNSDGSYTISHRSTPSRAEPRVTDNPPRVARIHQPLTLQSASSSSMSFVIPAQGDLSHDIIWAFSRSRPPTNAVDATIGQHIAQGTLRLNLNKPFAESTLSDSFPTQTGATGTAYRPPTSTGSPFDDLPAFELPELLPYQKKLVAHAVVSSFGFLLILPIGALVGRWMRLYNANWFKFHWIIQAVLGAPLIVAGWALGVAAVVEKGGTHFDDTHKVVGLVLLGVYVLQILLGVHIHLFKPKSFLRPIPMSAVSSGNRIAAFFQTLMTSNRPMQNYLHAVIGLSIIAIAFYNVYLGLFVEWALATGRGEVPDSYKRLWMAWVVIIPLAYVAGLGLLPRQLASERKTQQAVTRGSDALPLKQSPPGSKRSVKGTKISLPKPIPEGEWKTEPVTTDPKGGVVDDMPVQTNRHTHHSAVSIDETTNDSHELSRGPVAYAGTAI